MRSLGKILSSTRVLWPSYVAILFTSVLITTTALLMPFIISGATDEVVDVVKAGGHTDGHVKTIVWFAVALLVADLANTFISNIGGYIGDVAAVRMRRILSTRYFEKLLTLPQSYFDRELTGTIINRLSRNISETTQFLNMFANNFLPMLLTTFAVLIISAVYSWPLALLLLIVFPVYMYLTTLTSKKWQVLEQQKNEQFDIAGGRFAEVVGQIRVVKSFGQEKRELTSFDDRYASTVATTRVQSRYWHLMDAARRGSLNVIFFGVYAIVFVQTVRGVFTIGDMVLLIQLVNMARQPVMMMSYLVDSGQRAVAGSRDYFKVLDEMPERDIAALAADDAPASRASSATARGSDDGRDDTVIEFDDATFGYDDNRAVLEHIDLSIRHGERIAFVGESGGGKTTLISLLLGLYRLREGRLSVFGRDVDETPLAQLRSDFGVVFQDSSLFSGTIRENIAYGRPDASEEEIVDAAKRANADIFIRRFDDGYDTTIGERGLKLSGGQKQRIAVARAMLKDAPILILDEATSALDTKSERLVQAGLDELMEGRTSLIIAHRLSTISTVDRIVTLRDGRIDEVGPPEELAVSGGIYAELLALQASGRKTDKKRLKEYDIAG
ncbi:ABC transporter ATP-binding protein [Dermacoccus sp. PAMC28757]|uniref:ABC transporter ATP-binding protein n=1 Tax=Dermacoccus sp. PAMC28757 TaxID=2762331 RepID=UPI00164DC81F|nr:ABC transporter ATP-binding protein [Dermacoccus sp. PAMC28757]QNK52838.1 ABC transporter ATP-binding protein [Dermacoccus sp. PAMC28757]